MNDLNEYRRPHETIGKLKAENERLQEGNEKLKTEIWHLQAVNGALKIALLQAYRALEGK
jgi:hypothetical protein